MHEKLSYKSFFFFKNINDLTMLSNDNGLSRWIHWNGYMIPAENICNFDWQTRIAIWLSIPIECGVIFLIFYSFNIKSQRKQIAIEFRSLAVRGLVLIFPQ